MRAAAVALVLLVGAAIVLWYANTLNSWVLGGLIGGLAALLLSIPISLTLFSYLSRRHDEQIQAQEQEDLARVEEEAAHEYEYMQSPSEVEADVYLASPTDERIQRSTGRNLPAPTTSAPSASRLPAARQYQQPQQYQQYQQSQQLASSENQQYRQRANDYRPEPVRQQRPAQSPQPPQPPQPSQTARGQGNQSPTRRPPAAKPVRYPGFPGYQGSSQRGYHQTMALRAARLEATRQQEPDTEVIPTNPSKRLPIVRPDQRVSKIPKSSRQLQAQQQPPQHYQSKRTVDGSSLPPGRNRALSGPDESTTTGTSASYRIQEPQTDQIGTRYPQTGQFRRPQSSPQTGQTGQTTRNPQIESQPLNPDRISGSLQHPLVRRAPYMYEDDPLRQELAQQINNTGVRRRSSRYQEYEDEEEQ